jgi:hypothetical protein
MSDGNGRLVDPRSFGAAAAIRLTWMVPCTSVPPAIADLAVDELVLAFLTAFPGQKLIERHRSRARL